MRNVIRFGSVGLLAMIACSSPGGRAPAPAPPPPATAKVESTREIGRLGDVAVVSYPPAGFETLPPRSRALAYHLASAALASDSLFTAQTSRHGLPAQRAVRAILAKGDRLEPATRERLAQYRRFLFAYHGLYDHRQGGRKYTPPVSRDEFECAARATEVAVPADLLAAMFDPKVEPLLVNKSPGPGKDPVAESAANHYEGLTSKDLAGYRERFELNGRLLKQGGKVVEQVYRAGDARTPPGLGAPAIGRMVGHLKDAMPLAPEAERRALDRLAAYLETGENERMREHDIAWLSEAFSVDYIFGFLDTYNDVRQRKGSFMAMVTMPDPERNPPLQRLARQASYYEQRLPFAPAYKREAVRPPAAEAVIALAAAADAGPFSIGGMNLPDAQDLKEKYGSKNFFVSSTNDVGIELVGRGRFDEFAPPEARAEIRRCLRHLPYSFVTFHEVVGHGSGKVSPSLGDEPQKLLEPHFGTLEEGRADLVADYLTGDAKTVEIGVLPDAGCARIYPAYKMAHFLSSHMNVPQGDLVEEDHLRGAFIEFGVLRDKGVVSVERREEKTYFVVKDPDAWRGAVGELLGEYQRIKATGDRAAIASLVEKYATRLNPQLRDEVVARNAALKLPRRIAMVPPVLTPVRDAAGRVVDAKAEQVGSFDAYIDMVERASDP